MYHQTKYSEPLSLSQKAPCPTHRQSNHAREEWLLVISYRHLFITIYHHTLSCRVRAIQRGEVRAESLQFIPFSPFIGKIPLNFISNLPACYAYWTTHKSYCLLTHIIYIYSTNNCRGKGCVGRQ